MSSALKQFGVVAAVVGVVLGGIAVIAMNGNRQSPLRVDVLSARRAEPGEQVAITISARSNKGCPSSVVVDFGDGSDRADRAVDRAAPCETPIAQSFDFPHVYSASGVFTVEATVTSTAGETDTAVRTIKVKPLRRPGE